MFDLLLKLYDFYAIAKKSRFDFWIKNIKMDAIKTGVIYKIIIEVDSSSITEQCTQKKI